MAEGWADIKRNEEIPKETKLFLRCCCCNNRLINPVYLPCGHTIDKRCVQNQIPFGNCPICRRYFNINEQFPENVFLQRIADIARCRKYTTLLLSELPCNFYDHPYATVASVVCAVCKLRFCERCKLLHDKIPEARKHETYFADNEVQEKAIIEKRKLCTIKRHVGRRIISWCYDCKLLACADCCECGHPRVDVSNAASNVEEKLRKVLRKLNQNIATIRDQQEIINVNEKNLDFDNNEDLFTFSAFAPLRYGVIKESVYEVFLQSFYLRNEIRSLLKHAGDIEILMAEHFLNIQQINIRKTLGGIEPRPKSISSTDESYSINQDLVERQSVSSNYPRDIPVIYENESFDDGLTTLKKREEKEKDQQIYANELMYTETEVQMRKPFNETFTEITETKSKFDAEIRITGMTLLNDTIIITSRSAGLCAGYEVSGERKWTITEKLTGPFDLDSYRSDNRKHYLFISDPGKTDESKSAIRVYQQKENYRYTHLTRFTNECVQPRGVCVYAGRVYICEPQKQEVTEYQICKNFTGKIVTRYNEQNVLKEPIYVSAQVLNEKIVLIVSDREMGLKRLVKGEGGSTNPGWAVSNEKSFTPSKCFIVKERGGRKVFVGNTSGQKIHLINFEPRQISHRQYSLEDVNGPVALSVSEKGPIVVACKDGTVLSYEMKEAKEMERLAKPELSEDENVYELL